TNFNGVTTTHTQSGWTGGGGVEWAFADNWTAKVEYLYVNLGNGTVNCGTSACLAASGGPIIPVSVSLTEKSLSRRREFQIQLLTSAHRRLPNIVQRYPAETSLRNIAGSSCSNAASGVCPIKRPPKHYSVAGVVGARSAWRVRAIARQERARC